jgi:hypothetical protein
LSERALSSAREQDGGILRLFFRRQSKTLVFRAAEVRLAPEDRLRANTMKKVSLQADLSLSLKNGSYFLGAIESLAALATRNFTTVLAAILMGSPV